MLCPDNVSLLFSDESTSITLQNAVSAVVKWRLNNTALENTWKVFETAHLYIHLYVSNSSLTVRSCICWMTELAKSDALSVYFTAVAFLHVALKISRIGFTDELMDVLATVTGHFINRRRHPSQCSSELSLSKATKLMNVVENSSRSTMQLIEIELSKAYLFRALRCKD